MRKDVRIATMSASKMSAAACRGSTFWLIASR